MKNNLINFDILKSLKTTKEAKEFSSNIDLLLGDLFKDYKKPFEETLKERVDLKTAEALKRAFNDKSINLNDNMAVENFLTSLKNEVQKLKILKLYLAFDPTDEITEDILEWVSKNIGAGIILDIEKNESLIGGAIIVFNGKYQDLTIKKQLEELFDKKKDAKLFTLASTQN